jgi:hypothetical protein
MDIKLKGRGFQILGMGIYINSDGDVYLDNIDKKVLVYIWHW